MAVERTYENAIRIIHSRSRAARPTSILSPKESTKRTPIANSGSNLKGAPSISGMVQWLEMIGHSMGDIHNLNIVHCAGTKGKGSTCAFTESFLRAHGRRTGFPRTTGLYTSDNLMYPEERIRINSKPLSQTSFTEYFFELYDRLPQLATPFDPSKDVLERGPRSLQLYALLAFHVFIRERVDVSVIETHSGGEYDATNFVQKPLVTAITSLGMDHVDMLGPTIEDIAWHKSGIYKSGVPALSAGQDAAPAAVLERRASDKGEKVRFVGEDRRLPSDAPQLYPHVQRMNAALAIASVETVLQSCASGDDRILTESDIAAGIEQFSWPGRFQTIHDGRRTWYLDSAHNEMSAPVAAEWFAESSAEVRTSSSAGATRILIFSHINELRDTKALLECLSHALSSNNAGIQHVIFSTYDEHETREARRYATDPARLADIWKTHHPQTEVWNEPSIQGAIARAKDIGRDGMQTLITGSQHLVGPSLRILNNVAEHTVPLT